MDGARHAHLDLHERLQRARESLSGERHRALRRVQAGKFLQRGRTRRRASRTSRCRSASSRGRSKILVRQIAGLIARRIVTYSKQGDAATQGDAHGPHPLRLARRRLPSARTRRFASRSATCTVAGIDRPRGAQRRSMNAPRRAAARRPNVRRARRAAARTASRSLNLFCGIFAIVLASRGEFVDAGWCVVLGGIVRCARRPRRARDGHRQPVRRGARLARRCDLVRLRAGVDHVLRGAQSRCVGVAARASSSSRAR